MSFSLFCAVAFLQQSANAQQDSAIGESMRVQITGRAGLQTALADLGVIGDQPSTASLRTGTTRKSRPVATSPG